MKYQLILQFPFSTLEDYDALVVLEESLSKHLANCADVDGHDAGSYIIRASFSQERMTYIAAGESANGVAKVIYESKDGKTSKTFDALDWLAQLTSHIPNRGEQMVRYYEFYSNRSRGLRKKASTDDVVPALIEAELSSKEFRKSWARLIQKIYPAPAGLIHWCVLSAWGL